MSNKTPKITVPGLRGGVPGGYVLGRQKGKGPVQLLSQPRATNPAVFLSRVMTPGGSFKLPVSTVADLPSAATEGAGAMRAVSDGKTPTLGAAVAGTGSIYIVVVSNGTFWVVN